MRDIDKILDEVYEMSWHKPLDPETEFTAQQYMERHDLPEWSARYALNQLVKEGKLTKRKAYFEGHLYTAYRVVEDINGDA